MLIHCENDKCKFYYEDSCEMNLNNKMISLDNTGKCMSFEKGKSESYNNSEEEKRYILTREEVLLRLPDGEYIHTFRQGGPTLIGADWSREEILKAIDKYPFELSGYQATNMGHGMAFCDEHGWVFVETK